MNRPSEHHSADSHVSDDGQPAVRNRPFVRRTASFFGKLLAIYGLWYVVYDLWLLPDGRFDAWLSVNVAQMSGAVLSGFGYDAVVQGRDVLVPGVPGVRIVNGCNGLSTIGLFIGFVVAFPGRMGRRLAFLPLGMLVIFLANVMRISSLVIMQWVWPAGFTFVHDLGAPMFFYLIVFGLWVVWVNYGGSKSGPFHAPEPKETTMSASTP